jgi:HD-GYP domain-containing protein (c-di-GMP phosphodiesterase class II)
MNTPHDNPHLARDGRLSGVTEDGEPTLVRHVVERLRQEGVDANAVCTTGSQGVVSQGIDGPAASVLSLPGCGVWGVATACASELITPMTRAWTGDARDLIDARQALDGFTSQMSDAYDTIDFLYSIGRSMRKPDAPEAFIAVVVERLHQVMHFGWVAARFLDAERVPMGLRGMLRMGGAIAVGETAIGAALDEAAARLGEGARRWEILAEHPVLSSAGASQVLVQPVTCEGRLVGVIAAGCKGGLDPLISSYDLQLVEAAAGHVSAFVENVALYQAQQDLFVGTIQAITAALDAKDRYTRGHSERVAFIASQIAMNIGLDVDTCLRVHVAGLVHDVGKIGVPEAVLTKRGRLTDEEFGLIKLHPTIGHGILKGIPLLEDVNPAVLHHHERIDGRGYPAGLKGEEIPLYARILSVADTFDAMSSDRSYRPAMPREKVLAELQRSAGTQLDPKLVEAFMRIELSTYDQMVERHAKDETGTAAAVLASTDSQTQHPKAA